jgi:Flp pilus assembly protein TadG
MRYIRRKFGERGAAVVEFAVVVPLLLVLLFGIIEFAIILYDKAMITNASREGARRGIVAELTNRQTEITDTVNNYLYAAYPSTPWLISFGSSDTLTVATDPSDPGALDALNRGENLKVIVTYHYDFLLIPDFISGLAGLKTTGLNLTADTTMKVE